MQPSKALIKACVRSPCEVSHNHFSKVGIGYLSVSDVFIKSFGVKVYSRMSAPHISFWRSVLKNVLEGRLHTLMV